MRLLVLGILIAISFILSGCTKQPERINSSSYPQIDIMNKNDKDIRNQLIATMSEKNYSLVDASDYKMGFRKVFADGEDAFARALMQSTDGSTIDSRGVDFTFYTIENKTTIKAMPYLYKTFAYNRKTPEKFDLKDNNNIYNDIQKVLNRLQ